MDLFWLWSSAAKPSASFSNPSVSSRTAVGFSPMGGKVWGSVFQRFFLISRGSNAFNKLVEYSRLFFWGLGNLNGGPMDNPIFGLGFVVYLSNSIQPIRELCWRSVWHGNYLHNLHVKCHRLLFVSPFFCKEVTRLSFHLTGLVQLLTLWAFSSTPLAFSSFYFVSWPDNHL